MIFEFLRHVLPDGIKFFTLFINSTYERTFHEGFLAPKIVLPVSVDERKFAFLKQLIRTILAGYLGPQ